jgi:hypothetical protein
MSDTGLFISKEEGCVRGTAAALADSLLLYVPSLVHGSEIVTVIVYTESRDRSVLDDVLTFYSSKPVTQQH